VILHAKGADIAVNHAVQTSPDLKAVSLPPLSPAAQVKAIEILTEKSLPYRELMAYYKCAMMEIETKFNVLNQEFSLLYNRNPIESIKSRLKEPSSVIEKLMRRGLPLTIESVEQNIFDIAGIRIICSFCDDIYMLADCLLAQDDVKLVAVKDYIKKPKDNGYRSLHLIVEVPIFLAKHKKYMKVEIQLRTIAMDFWASLDHKLKYKKDVDNPELIEAQLKDCAGQIAALDKRMEDIRKQIEGESDQQIGKKQKA